MDHLRLPGLLKPQTGLIQFMQDIFFYHRIRPEIWKKQNQHIHASAVIHPDAVLEGNSVVVGEGAKIAIELGLPLSIVNIIERHVGAGIPFEEAENLGLPPKDYIPITLEEKIVSHADNLIDNDQKHPIEIEVEKALKIRRLTLK
jgi:uncharacterized protein (TIGR00295 family)